MLLYERNKKNNIVTNNNNNNDNVNKSAIIKGIVTYFCFYGSVSLIGVIKLLCVCVCVSVVGKLM